MTFSARLKELCRNAGVSEADLAAKSGIRFGTLHRWWLGRSEPPFSGVLRICRALRVELRAFEACEPVVK